MNRWIIGDGCWKELFIAQEASGVGVKEFCKNERVCETSFYDKRRELGMVTGQKLQVLQKKAPQVSRISNGFIRLKPPVVIKPAPQMNTIRIETPNGYAVQMGCVDHDLRSCLEVLKCL